MLILLPPSEGKTTPTTGSGVNLDKLSAPRLAPQRRKVMDALIDLSQRTDASSVLGVGPRLAVDVAANVHLFEAHTAPAAQVYTGVLYEAAGFAAADLPDLAKARLRDSVRTVSALWGIVSPLDLIPAYRLAMGVKLPGIGSLPQFWRESLDDVLGPRTTGDVVVDCRSASYVSAWRPGKDQDWVSVRVLRERDGKRSVVSHNAKHTRGVLAGHLVSRTGPEPRTSAEVLAATHELVGSDLLAAQLLPGAGNAQILELIVS